jgi:hypothetical protein
MNLQQLNYDKLKKLKSDTMYQEVNYFCHEEKQFHKYIVICNFSEDENFDYDYIECQHLINELNHTEFYLT